MMASQTMEHSETSLNQQAIVIEQSLENKTKDMQEDDPLLKALGVTTEGKCIRHPNSPVLNLATSEVIPCRVCFSEEKSVGIRQNSGTFQTVVQELQRHSQSSGLNLNSSHSSNLSSCPNDDLPPMESVVKRLTQVQNWMLRQKEKEVLSLQLRINQLEQQLQTERTSNQELKNTVKALRKTIQQDLRVIKHMQDTGSPAKTPSPQKAMASVKLPDRNLERAFQSFRGGLLDIPKSPPPVQHTEKKDDTKLQLNTAAVQALRLRSSLSRSNSHAVPNDSSNSKEIPLDVLAAKLTDIPVQRKIAGQSPEQFFPDTVPSTGMPKAQMLDDVAEDVAGEAEAEDESTMETSKDPNKTVFTVTGAVSQDKFGDQGLYTGQILVTTGLPHGKGVMEYDSGRMYDGDWVSGQWHGRGNLQNPNGDSYEGEFCLDARHGTGVYKWDNGDVYTGDFRSDKRHGKGTFCFFNGNKYVGEFCNGVFQGFGKYEFAGGYYEGEWKEGRYHGNGELLYANGGKYTGEFRNSVAHGFGMEVLPDGTKRRGVWSDGKPTEVFDNKEDEQD